MKKLLILAIILFTAMVQAPYIFAGIVSSTYVVDATPQADGRRWVKETHIDQSGNPHYAEYLASDGTDYQAIMQSRAVNIGAELDRMAAIEDEAANTQINYRRIRPDAFSARFTLSEQIRLEATTDPVLKVFEKNAIVIDRPYIDLDHPLVQQAMPYLRDHGILDGDTAEARQARMDAILADGTVGEM